MLKLPIPYPIKSLQKELKKRLADIKQKNKEGKRKEKLFLKEEKLKSKKAKKKMQKGAKKYEEYWDEIIRIINRHIGAKNPIIAQDLDELIFPQKYEDPNLRNKVKINVIDREIRENIRLISIHYKLPIINLGSGYFIATTDEEVEAYREQMMKHIRGCYLRLEDVALSYKDYYKDSVYMMGKWRKITKKL